MSARSIDRFATRALRMAFVLAITLAASLHARPVIAQGDMIYDQLIFPPSLEPTVEFSAPAPASAEDGEARDFAAAPPPRPSEALVNAEYLARAAAFADSTRLEGFAEGTFLPSAIPVDGQPFFDTDPRANLQGDGSAVRLKTVAPATSNVRAAAVAQLIVQNASVSGTETAGDTNLTVRQVYGVVNRISVGLMESAFADPLAVPETLDLAGPNARITAFDAGVGGGQGRLSYDLLSDSPLGFEIVASVEQAIPEIDPPADDETIAHYPDLVGALQYLDGYQTSDGFVETWHVQWGTVVRDLGIESPNADDQNQFAWGTALSGGYGFALNPNVEPLDRIKFSIAYGEGISHYIVDLNAAPDTGDAVVNAAGQLEALPAFAAYLGYTHNWTNCLRSTASCSHVNLDSTLPLAATASPYQSGEFFALNLVHRMTFFTPTDDDPAQRNLFTGVEYLFGRKETLDGADGDAHRLMFVVVISN